MSVFKRTRDPYGSTTAQSPSRQSTQAPAPHQWEEPPSPAPTSTPAPTEPQVAPTTAPVLQRDAAAVIDKNSELKGTLHSEGNILVEGAFEGDMDARETILVDRNAEVQGKLNANDVVISGSFQGEIVCQHRLHITASASIKGEIKTPILVVEEGSTADCSFEMTRSGRLE